MYRKRNPWLYNLIKVLWPTDRRDLDGWELGDRVARYLTIENRG